jgi:hypothetical protein
MKMKRTGRLALLAGFACAAPALASDPVGVYALIDKVVLEPSETAPARIQVWGAFALTDGRRGDGYQAPQRGYLYLAVQPGKEDVCRKEWADLKALAGSGEGVGFGFRYQPAIRLRRPDETAASPDTYPTGVGVVRMGRHHNQPAILQELKRLGAAGPR